METATFGAGCFWGVEAKFRTIKGIISTQVGYLGGQLKNPTYEDVCHNNTGHAEVVQITFNSEVIKYSELLDVFWKCHNPTTLNRQGPDTGTQYRSAVFYHNEEQKIEAEKSKQSLEEKHIYKDKIVTEITATSTFYKAEEYHQQYLEKKGLASCHI